jgi:hypothetical protein
MKAILFLLTAIVFIQVNGTAQSSTKLKFSSINQVGLVSGSNGNAYLVQTINGFSCYGFSAGIGVGIDDYFIKSIPVFTDLRKNILKQKNTPFVYFDMGANLSWEKSESDYYVAKEYKPGIYYDAGLGYNWSLLKKYSVVLSVGYTQKNATLDEKPVAYIPIFPGPTVCPNRNAEPGSTDYAFRRLSMKLGLGF